jgi:RimJ/RimL family protein N-acetyltransferase
MTLILRQPTSEDIPFVWKMLEQNWHLFATDYDFLDISTAERICTNGMSLLICEEQQGLPDYPIGLIWLTDPLEDLWCHFHFICRPTYLYKIIKTGISKEIFNTVFKETKFRKLKAAILDNQQVGKKLLLKFGFKQRGYFPRENRQNGKYRAAIIFELTKQHWIISQKEKRSNG